MNDLVNYIIFFSGTFAGGLVVYFMRTLFEHRLAISRSIEAIRITEFNKAAAEFRTNFVDIIQKLRHTKMSTGDECFSTMRQFRTLEVNNIHEKAKIRFEPFIEKVDFPGFNAAWDDYYDWQKHIKNQDNNVVPDFLGHIYALLEYAKPKL